MNIWIASLGKKSVSNLKSDHLNKIAGDFFRDHHELTSFTFTSNTIRYFSVALSNNTDCTYNQEFDNRLIAYSGFPVPKIGNYTDLRSVQNWKQYFNPLTDAPMYLMGQFALLKADDFSFECIVDNLGFQKVYYYHSKEHILVSNHLPFIKSLINADLNEIFHIQFLAAGGIVGDSTQYKDIRTLTEYGWLQWNHEKGLTIKTYKNIDNLLADEGDRDTIRDKMLLEWDHASNYLVDFHEIIVPLSGGYDSRTVLSMFWNKDKSNIQCYNYPDKPLDRSLAIKVAKDHNVQLNLLKPDSFPTLDDLYNFVKKTTDSFLDFGDIFNYMFQKEIDSLFSQKLKAIISGNAGESHYGMELQKKLSNQPLPLDLTISNLAQFSINQSFLTKDGYKFLERFLIDYYREKYISKLSRISESLDFLSLYFSMERVGAYKGQQLQEKYRDRLFYMPYGSETFIQLVNATPKKERGRSKKGGIHHSILSHFTSNMDHNIRFVNRYHWEAGKIGGYFGDHCATHFGHVVPPVSEVIVPF